MQRDRYYHMLGEGELDALARRVVDLIAKDFPQPSSTNTQIGFKLRCGRLYRELRAYIELNRADVGVLPNEEQLEAAGRSIYARFARRSDWCRFPNPDEELVAIADYTEIFAEVGTRGDGR